MYYDVCAICSSTCMHSANKILLVLKILLTVQFGIRPTSEIHAVVSGVIRLLNCIKPLKSLQLRHMFSFSEITNQIVSSFQMMLWIFTVCIIRDLGKRSKNKVGPLTD